MSFQTDPSRFEQAKTSEPQGVARGTGGRRIAQAPATHAPVQPAARCFE
ncbi:MAG: hypothetical protein ACU0BS_09385 [Hasllibacter sp.]